MNLGMMKISYELIIDFETKNMLPNKSDECLKSEYKFIYIYVKILETVANLENAIKSEVEKQRLYRDTIFILGNNKWIRTHSSN